MKKPKVKYCVTKDGIDCGYASPKELGFVLDLPSGHSVSGKITGTKKLLVKKPAEQAEHFGTQMAAEKAITRTEKYAAQYRGTMVDSMPKIQPLVERGVFAVRQVRT